MTETLRCGLCKVELEHVADPSPSDLVACPRCGASESLENAVRIANEPLVDVARSKLIKANLGRKPGSKFVNVSTDGIKYPTDRPLPKFFYG